MKLCQDVDLDTVHLLAVYTTSYNYFPVGQISVSVRPPVLTERQCKYRHVTNIESISDDDSNDDSVDGDRLTEDDADQILGSNPRRFYSTADNTTSRRKNTPTVRLK